MRKVFEILAGLGCIAAVILAGGSEPDGSCCLPWSLSFLAIAALCGWAFHKLQKPSRNVL